MRITNILVGVALFLCVSFMPANPIFVSYINEFRTTHDSSLEAIELHPIGDPGSVNVNGWTIRTRAGTATIPSGIIQSNGYLVIDTFSIYGTFCLNEIADSIRLYDSQGYLRDKVIYGYLGSKVPAPPYGGSACLYRTHPAMYWDLFSWYIDSTPTFEYTNDDWSSISGVVLNAQGQPMSGYCVIANGCYGSSCAFTDSTGNFNVCGLGQSNYWLTVWTGNCVFAGNYPDSVYVGYSQNVPNINITLPLGGIEQTTKLSQSDFTFVTPNPFNNNAKISFVLPFETEVLLKIYDIRGVLLKTILNQRFNAGHYQIGLNLNLVQGVYFLNAETGQQRVTKKLVILK